MWEWLKTLSLESKITSVLVALLLVAILFAWYHPENKLPTKIPVVLPAISSVVSVPKEVVNVPKLKVYRKSNIAKKVILPADVVTDPNKQVTAVVDVPPSPAGAEVTAVVDVVTGDTVLLAREKELPLLAFETMKRIGVGYGVGTAGTEAKVFIEYTFARVGNFYLSVYAEVDAGAVRAPEAKALATVDYRTK